MRLASNNLWVASAAIVDALRANPNYAGRDAASLDNGGTRCRAAMSRRTGSRSFPAARSTSRIRGSIQPFTMDFAGITAGSGGLTISAAAPNANVTAFGRRLNADGSFTTGDAFFFQSTYNTAGGGAAGSYTPAAALNTCIIVTGQCGRGLPPCRCPGRRCDHRPVRRLLPRPTARPAARAGSCPRPSPG